MRASLQAGSVSSVALKCVRSLQVRRECNLYRWASVPPQSAPHLSTRSCRLRRGAAYTGARCRRSRTSHSCTCRLLFAASREVLLFLVPHESGAAAEHSRAVEQNRAAERSRALNATPEHGSLPPGQGHGSAAAREPAAAAATAQRAGSLGKFARKASLVGRMTSGTIEKSNRARRRWAFAIFLVLHSLCVETSMIVDRLTGPPRPALLPYPTALPYPAVSCRILPYPMPTANAAS